MLNFRNIALALLLLLAGIWIGERLSPKEIKIVETKSECKDLETTKRKLQELSQTDYQEYLRLKDSPEKAQKANDLLSKIMLLFLADMGFKIQPQATKPVPPVAPPPKTVGSLSNSEPVPVIKSGKGNPREWVTNESEITNTNSERDAIQNLKGREIPNLFDELRVSGALSQPQINALNGDYTGEITFSDGSPAWTIDWHLDARYENGALKGTSSVKMSKGGVVFSHSSGDGVQKDFTSAKDSAAIFVKANGDQGYMQLYPSTGRKPWSGLIISKRVLINIARPEPYLCGAVKNQKFYVWS